MFYTLNLFLLKIMACGTTTSSNSKVHEGESVGQSAVNLNILMSTIKGIVKHFGDIW